MGTGSSSRSHGWNEPKAPSALKMTYIYVEHLNDGIPYQMLLKKIYVPCETSINWWHDWNYKFSKENVAARHNSIWSDLIFHIWENAMSTNNNWGIAYQGFPLWLTCHQDQTFIIVLLSWIYNGKAVWQWCDIRLLVLDYKTSLESVT